MEFASGIILCPVKKMTLCRQIHTSEMEKTMAKIKVTCDSICDLTPELYQKYDIRVVPLGVSLGDDFRYDSVNVTAQELYDYVDRTGELPKTSAVSIGEYEEIFVEYVRDGYEVIHINLSGELSTSHQSAHIAASSVGHVYVVDSRSLSTGSGHLALMAARLVREGLSAKEIYDILNERREKLDVSFVLQTLDYIHKGGRCSGIAAFGANLLKLRPEIEVKDGKLVVGKKFRGTAEKSVLAYVRNRLEGRADVQTDRIFVTHSGISEEIIGKVVTLVKELHPFKEVIVTRAGSTISCHCGPECLGVLFFRQ